MLVNTARFFVLLRTHYKFAPADRRLDLKHRLRLVALDEKTDPVTRRYLLRFIDRKLAQMPAHAVGTDAS